MSINTSFTALADAIRNKASVSGKLSIAAMTEAVNGIVINTGGGDINFDGVTVTADKLLDGVVAIDKNGNKITGNIKNGDVSRSGAEITVSAGYYVEDVLIEYPILLEENISIVGNDVKIPAGYYTEETSFTLPYADVNVDGGTIIVGQGYVSETQEINLPTAEITVNENTVNIESGYVAEFSSVAIPESTITETSSNVTITPGYVAEKLSYDLGSGGVAVEYGYINADGNIQKLDLSGDAPVDVDAPVNMDIVLFATGQAEPAYSGGGETPAGGTFNLAKVTEYTPYSAAMTAVTSIELSGLGILGDPDYDSTDLTNANGLYTVTEETASETDWRKRIYQNSNGYQLRNYYDAEYEEGYWYIRDPDGWEAISYYTTDMLTSGTNTWENWDYGYSCDVTAALNETTFPEQPLVLKGVMAESYTDETWTFADTETTFAGFEKEPVVSCIYATDGTNLIGKTIGREKGAIPNGAPTDGLTAWFPFDGDVSDLTGDYTGEIVGDVDLSNGYATNWSASNYIKLPYKVLEDTSEWTIAMVINSPGGLGGGYLQSGSTLELRSAPSMKYRFQLEGSGTKTVDSPGITNAKNQLLIFTNSATENTLKLYWEGAEAASAKASGSMFGTDFKVGFSTGLYDDRSNPCPANTQIKNVVFYNRAISANEAKALYNSLKQLGELD